MARYLKQTHPLFEKVNKLSEFCETLGIRLTVQNDNLSATDTTTNVEAVFEDLEDWHKTQEFPPSFEFKLRLYPDQSP